MSVFGHSHNMTFIFSLLLSLGFPGFAYANDQTDIQNSIVRYRAAIEVNPTNPKNHLNLGKIYLTNGDLSLAANEFKAATKLNPADPEAQLALSRVWLHQGNLEAAISAMTCAEKLNHQDADIHYKLGQLFFKAQRLDESIREYRLATANPTKATISANAHRDLGAILGMKGDYAGQISEETKALTLNANDADTLYYLGSAYVAQGHTEKALASLTRCVVLDPKNIDAAILLGLAQASSNKFADAITTTEAALKANPGNPRLQKLIDKLQKEALARKKS